MSAPLVARIHSQVAGPATAFELALRFTAWARALHRDPTVPEICRRWRVSRATAYRYLAAWRVVQQGSYASNSVDAALRAWRVIPTRSCQP